MPPKRRDTLPKSHRRVAGHPGPVAGQPKRVSRREREERQRRLLFWGVGVAAVAVLLVLSGASLNEYWIKPRHVLASVNGTDIRRRDYWKYRAVDLANQASQYASIANSGYVSQDQASQYSTLAQQTSAEIDKVWGSTSVDDPTLQKMIDDQVYLQSLGDVGITITNQDVDDYIAMQFGPSDAPIFTPTPSPTLIPERAAWATQTAVALNATAVPTVAGASPEASGTGSPAPSSPESQASPVDSPPTIVPTRESDPAVASPAPSASAEVARSTASPVAPPVVGSPVASPVAASPEATPEISPTPNQDQARQTATANFGSYQDAIFDRAHISRADYIRLIVRPAIAKQRIDDQLTANIGQTAEQVHAAHILVDTKDLADSIYQQVTQPGASFEQAAKDQSIDSATAPNGGDLGWFTRGQMVDAFEQVAFSTSPGQISQPVQTEFGWHIIKVYDHQNDRPMTNDQISSLKQSTISKWLDGKKAQLKIHSEIKPTATASGPQNFVPPPDAPPTPTATTEVPAASPEATIESGSNLPSASPVAVSGSPASGASPVAGA
jgi:hypothetical protein